jgi:hypothetical protein
MFRRNVFKFLPVNRTSSLLLTVSLVVHRSQVVNSGLYSAYNLTSFMYGEKECLMVSTQ